ncbi:MAG: TonB-dependent receptor [Bacteroidales bacterium]|jgi:TonB-linked SusC/RagA family outer membrane protein|nr:TonB-dependent receptor [Bacteroidales bacterium]
MKHILFYLIPLLSIVCWSELSAQETITVTGTITISEGGEPLPGASVVIEGTTKGAISDENGKYEINVSPTAVLRFSFVGMETQSIPIEGRRVIDVVLIDAAQTLEDVVIVGYGTQRKGNVISSMDVIQPDQLKLPTRTISTSLAGRLAGVVAVQSSGEPGYDGATFWIRGVNTFAGSSTPLVMVDGIERSMDNIDPEEIADFAILKDATATALYGVRGANGVVLITTKRGMAGKPKISLRAEQAFSSPVDLPEFVGAVEYMQLINEARLNSGQGIFYTDQRIANTANKVDPYYYPDVDWTKELIRNNSPSQKVSVNISGGGEKVRYFVNAGFLNQAGMFKDFKLYSYNNNINVKRYNFRSNVDIDVTNTTVVGLTIAAILEDRRYPGESTSDIFSWMRNQPPIMYPLNYPDKTKIPGEPYGQSRNPYQMLASSGYTDEFRTTIQSNIDLKQDLKFITEGLSAKLMFSFDAYSYGRVQRTLRPRAYLITPWGYDSLTGEPILTQDGEYNYVDQEPGSTDYYSYLKRTSDRPAIERTVYLEAQLNYNRNFGVHNVGGMLLYNQNDFLQASNEDIYNAVPKRYQGLTGRATYAYDNRYYFEFNFAYNGSENFAKGKRYGFFPAAAIGWVPTEESFMKGVKKYLEYMKIRFSYGQVGNDNIGAVAGVDRFAYLTRVQTTSSNVGYGTNNGYGYGYGAGVAITYYGNPDATWETATKADLGFEFRFLKNFRLQADFFHEKRTDIWVPLYNIPDIYGVIQDGDGVPAIGGNVGEMENKGIDGFLEYNGKISNDLSITFKGTYSYSRNKVLKNSEATPMWDYQDKVGRKHNMTLAYVAERLFIDEADIAANPDQSFLGGTSLPGDIKYKDINNDGVIDDYDREFTGYPSVPEISYGLGAGIQYKNFDFSFLFQGSANVSFFAKPKAFGDVNRENIYTYIRDNRWTEDNQDPNAKIPRPQMGTQNKNYVNSTWWQVNGRYLRLKQVELGFTFPKAWTDAIHLKHVRIYTNGLNLFTISPFDLWDAESKSSSGFYYPIQRVFNFGLEINF